MKQQIQQFYDSKNGDLHSSEFDILVLSNFTNTLSTNHVFISTYEVWSIKSQLLTSEKNFLYLTKGEISFLL